MDHERDHSHAPGPGAVTPTAERLGADLDLTGRGITIALLDAGFTAHPDVANRIVGFHAVEDPDATFPPSRPPHPWEWHGTQTTVVAAGDGALSDGIYRGLAPAARLLLVQVGREGSIHDAEIARALEWLLANFERYGVRIVNISLGGDVDAALPDSRVNQLAQEAVGRGLVVVAAAGNSGGRSEHRAVPPASAPSVITVGGYHDWSSPEGHAFAMYWSSFGDTADGFAKPELIAPAIEVAAPIPVDAPEFQIAQALTRLAAAPDEALAALAREIGCAADLPEEIADGNLETIRAAVETKLRERKIVAAHYQHVDGTSFAAPIVASLAAQMLEANPTLTPAQVREILVRTAGRIDGAPAERQGFGVIHAGRAVEAARKALAGCELSPDTGPAPGVAADQTAPRVESGKVIFLYRDSGASEVAVAGEFNRWEQAAYAREADGTWRVEIDVPPPGRYRYKLLIDGDRWREDPGNAAREVDPFGAFDSILSV